MSTLRNAVHRRDHKERAQPLAREKRGLLEKHKDYVLRAKDYNFKQKRLKSLKEKALFRNPDEFYFKMINARTKVINIVFMYMTKYTHLLILSSPFNGWLGRCTYSSEK